MHLCCCPTLQPPARLPPAALAGSAVLSTLFPKQAKAFDTLLGTQLNASVSDPPSAEDRAAVTKAAAGLAKDLVTEVKATGTFKYPAKAAYAYQVGGLAAPPRAHYKGLPGTGVCSVRAVCGRAWTFNTWPPIAGTLLHPRPLPQRPRPSAGHVPLQPTAGMSAPHLPALADAKPLAMSAERLDAILANTDRAVGPVLQPAMPRGADYNTTFKLGAKNSKDRSEDDTATVMFWQSSNGTSHMSGYWLTIALKVGGDRDWGLMASQVGCSGRAINTIAHAFGEAPGNLDDL